MSADVCSIAMKQPYGWNQSQASFPWNNGHHCSDMFLEGDSTSPENDWCIMLMLISHFWALLSWLYTNKWEYSNIYIYMGTHTWNLLWNCTRWVRFLCHNTITVRVIWVRIISYVLFLFKVYNCLVIGEKYMRRAVSWTNCAVYHEAVRFREKKCTAVSFCLVSPMCHNAFEILLTAKKI